MDRRTFICTGTGVMITAVAGCSGGNETNPPHDTETDTPPQGEDTRSVTEASSDGSETALPTGQESQTVNNVISDSVVDYSTLTNGAGSVSDSGFTIEYSSPDVRLNVDPFVNGNEGIPDDADFRVSSDLSSDDPTIFFAPVVREDESTWNLHAFANTEFVDRHDWKVIRTNADGVGGEIDTEFSKVTELVHHFVVVGTPEGSRGVAVSTQSAADLSENGVTGTLFNLYWLEAPEETEAREERVAPEAAFSFDYNQDDQTLTIAHQGGDSIQVSELVVRVDGNIVDTAFNDVEGDTVTAGTTTTIDVSEYADSSSVETTTRVIWMGDDQSAILAESSR